MLLSLSPMRRVLLLCLVAAVWLVVDSILQTRKFWVVDEGFRTGDAADYSSSRVTTTAAATAAASDSKQQQPEPSRLITAWPNRHVSPLEKFQIKYNSLDDLPQPLRLLEQYKAWHSHEALERDPFHRRYMVAYYQCPVSAGNWLHYLTSTMYWSILTNRTLLWKYADEATCLDLFDHKQPVANRRCLVANATLQDCNSMIVRAPWIPAYDEWKDRLGLPRTRRLDRTHTQWFDTIKTGPNQLYQQVNIIGESKEYVCAELGRIIVRSERSSLTIICFAC